jgi:hypothetical protein
MKLCKAIIRVRNGQVWNCLEPVDQFGFCKKHFKKNMKKIIKEHEEQKLLKEIFGDK